MPKATILLADNDSNFAEVRTEILRIKGYQVSIALTPAQAKEIVEQGGIDLVILDIRLTDDSNVRDKSGLVVAKEIDPAIPKIIMTGYPAHEFVQEALSFKDGHPLAVDFLAKTEGPDALLAAIESALQQKKEAHPESPPQSYKEGAERPLATDASGNSSSLLKILFLAANPRDTPQLRLDEEIRAIDHALLHAEFNKRFDIKQHWAVRIFDLQGYLLRHKPEIVHFSGHGCSSSEIILEDNAGNSQPVSARALSQLFSVLRDNIRCVVLNACYSEQQAQAIAGHIDCVIGMSRSISDPAAIAFAAAFYQALGYGRDIKTAFELGCIQIDLEKLGEENTPKLLTLRSDPKGIVFVR
jgi:CheY-like chemotaxis protein